MQVVLLPSTVGGGVGQYLSTYIINGRVAVDAGALGLHGTPAEQAAIRHIFLTHSHIDHIAGLPIFIDNVNSLVDEPATVHGGREVLDCLQRDIFNDRVMPDFFRLSIGRTPFLRTALLEPGIPVTVEGLRITPVPVEHPVSTFAFLLEDDSACVAIVTDTRPTEAIWELARQRPRLDGVFLEATFPRAEVKLADVSGHLTTELFRQELQKVPGDGPVIAVHIKPRFHAEVVAELADLHHPRVQIAVAGRMYRFGP